MKAGAIAAVALLGLLALAPAAAAGALSASPVTPITAAGPLSRSVKVLVLKYFPVTADGKTLDRNVTGDVGDALATVRSRVSAMTTSVAAGLMEGSRYRGYADPAAPADLTFEVVDTKEFLTAVPAIPSTFQPAYLIRPDYATILNSIDICSYVRDQGVGQVWIWAYNGAHALDISESKMSGPYGDVSNSRRLNDMPACGRTYTVFTYNYGRGTAEAIHDHGHQLEAELTEVDAHLFGDLFVGTVAHPGGVATGRCGSVHNPPNARFEYDYVDAAANASDCLNWTPDGLGAVTPLSCTAWGCVDKSDTDNAQRNWLVWWMQNLPGRGNQITFQGRALVNWWDAYYDFDAVMGSCRTLVSPCVPALISGTTRASGLTTARSGDSGALEGGAAMAIPAESSTGLTQPGAAASGSPDDADPAGAASRWLLGGALAILLISMLGRATRRRH